MRLVVTVAASLLLPPAIGAAEVAGVVQWHVERRQVPRAGLQRRADKAYEETITNEKFRGGYFTTCSIGTPPQDITLQLDTGSSDTWVPFSGATICSGLLDITGCDLGSFDPDDSTTMEDFLPGALHLSYLDKTYTLGDYMRDTFALGGAVVKNMTMGLGINTTINHGLVGIGYSNNEGSVRTTGIEYNNLPVEMVSQQLINTVAYSLWLNDLSSNEGNILFGGIDTEKYVGELTRVSIIPDDRASGDYRHFTIPLTSVEARSPTGTDTMTSARFPIEVVLDSGTTLSYLPSDMVGQIWQEAGVEFVRSFQGGQGLIPCYRRESPGTFVLGFGGPGGPKITLGMDELVINLRDRQGPSFPSGKYKGDEVCLFGIQNFSQPPYLLGDTFLRSAYVVYDLVNNELGLAQTDFNETKSNIVAFPSNGSTVPSATAAPNQGQTDTPDGVVEPGYAAAKGFQNGAGSERAALRLQLVNVLALGLALYLCQIL